MEGFCPNCGALLSESVSACPECGSCEETGWSERARYDSLGIDYDGDEFDAEAALSDDWNPSKPRDRGRQLWLAIVALILVIFFVFAYF